MTNPFPPEYSPEYGSENGPVYDSRNGPQPHSQGGRIPLYIGIVVLGVIFAAAVAFFVFRGLGGEETTAAESSAPMSTKSGSILTAQNQDESMRASEEEDVVTVTETVPPEPETPATQRAADMPAGLSATGWIRSFASCNSGESLVFAGNGPDGQVALCQGSAGLTYRSHMFGGTLESPATESDGSYYVQADPALIIVTPGGVTVREGGALAANSSFSQSWSGR
ncbi:hypothetical protein [Corynebacterium flavescens]|uniref:Serine/threonine protein kinase n=1 Tax=Corynebacterium flavescens TaxID=28028 RepID=A0AB73B7L7_CORFL|nr:hypothetical protein [Corynebacterium flavescens]KAA8723657.1 hypothetical protein F4V60_04025 [Corynebacterium flavescens]GEB97653.1 hypothetical protein CFL01nite_11480 [Corynebacterium flavescens]